MSNARTLRPAASLDGWLVLAGLAGVAVVATGWGLAHQPWLTTGAVVGAVVAAAAFTRPLLIVGVMLVVGALDLSFLTGGFKALLEEQGGLDMNGIRLVGISTALAAVVVMDRAVTGELLGRHTRWYVLFLAYAMATLLIAPVPMDGLRLLFKLAYPLLVFVLVVGLAERPQQLERLSDWMLGGAAVIATVLLPLLFIFGAYEITVEGRLLIPLVGLHTNPLSFYLLLMILVSFGRYASRGQLRYLLLCAALAAWMIPTLTRITLAAALAGLGGAAVLDGLIGRNRRTLIAALAIAALIAVPLLPVVLERTFGYVPSAGELWRLARDPVALYETMNWQGRQNFWPIIATAFLSSPLVGLGLGASSAVLAAAPAAGGVGVAHNEYLRLAADTGLIGVALFALALLAWSRGVLRAGRTRGLLVRELAT
ncbi:MAG: O-antigen ligase family protein, partial [Longimicrobiales bacterium]